MSLFFALVLSPALKAAAAVLKNGLLFAYVDDVTIAGSLNKLLLHFKPLNPFSLSPDFALTPTHLSSMHWTFRIYQRCRNNFSNAPINRRNHCSWHTDQHPNFCLERATRTEKLVRQIQTLTSKQALFILCRDSANEKIILLARTVPPCNFFDAAARLNTAIFTALQSLTTIGELSEQLQTPALMQSALPTSVGGSWFCQLSCPCAASSFSLPTARCSQPSSTCR